ncbi:MAG: hypothetical protein ACPLKZ_05610 [Candidatus Bathyarchaeales archaeon]
MKKKKAIVTVELVDESSIFSNSTIAAEMLAWLRAEAVPAPWVKEVKSVVVLS